MTAITSARLTPPPDRFPPGTSVGAYRRTAWSGTDRSVAPTGAADATALVAADGSLSFTGLADQTTYHAWAVGSGPPVQFATRHNQNDDLVVALGGDLAPQLYYPDHLRRLALAAGDVRNARVDIPFLGDSITFGYGGDGTNAGNNVPDNLQGYVGQARATLAPKYGDPGEGFIFSSDSRVTPAGAPVNFLQYGPLRHASRLVAGQTLTVTIPAGHTALGVIQANQAGDVSATYTKNGGGSSNVAALTGSGVYIETLITGLVAGDVIVISGPATAQTYVSGVTFRNAAAGFALHRIGQNGYCMSDVLAGSNAGVLNQSAPNQLLAARSHYQWCPNLGMVVVAFGVNDQQFQTSGGTTNQSGITPTVYKAMAQQFCNQLVADGAPVLILGEPASPNAASSGSDQPEAAYRAARMQVASSTDHVAVLEISDTWGSAAKTWANGLSVLQTSVHPSRKGHGQLGQVIARVIEHVLENVVPSLT